MKTHCPRRFFLVVVFVVSALQPAFAQKKALTFTDIMKFRQIESPVISDDGHWVAYVLQQDHGDGEARVQSLESKKAYVIPRGTKPVFSKNARWVAMGVRPTAVELERTENDKDKPKSGMALVSTETGDTMEVAGIQSFAFSEDSRWLVYSKAKDDRKPDAPRQSDAGKDTSQSKQKRKKDNVGTDLIFRELSGGKETRIPFVVSYSIDSTSHFLAYAVADTVGGTNGVYVRDLHREGQPEHSVLSRENGTFTHLIWSNATGNLAFVGATMDDKEKPGPASLWLWDPTQQQGDEIVASDAAPTGWIVPSKNDVVWSKDGKRLFFGFRPLNQSDKPEAPKDTTVDVFDIHSILKKRGVDVWGWNDPRIIPNQKKRWKDVKDQTYRAVCHLDTRKVVSLANPELPYIDIPENPDIALGRSNVPYLKELTWVPEPTPSSTAPRA